MRNRWWKLICRALCSVSLSLSVSPLPLNMSERALAYHHGDRQLFQVRQWHAFPLSFQRWSYTTPPPSFSSKTSLYTSQKHNTPTKSHWNRCTQSIIIIHPISHNSQPESSLFSWVHTNTKSAKQKSALLKRSPSCSNETRVRKAHSLQMCVCRTLSFSQNWGSSTRDDTWMLMSGYLSGVFLCNVKCAVLQFGQHLVVVLQSACASTFACVCVK